MYRLRTELDIKKRGMSPVLWFGHAGKRRLKQHSVRVDWCRALEQQCWTLFTETETNPKVSLRSSRGGFLQQLNRNCGEFSLKTNLHLFSKAWICFQYNSTTSRGRYNEELQHQTKSTEFVHMKRLQLLTRLSAVSHWNCRRVFFPNLRLASVVHEEQKCPVYAHKLFCSGGKQHRGGQVKVLHPPWLYGTNNYSGQIWKIAVFPQQVG